MRIALSILLFLASTVSTEAARADWTMDLMLGGALNAPTNLTVRQDSQPDLYIPDAEFSTKPFEQPIYWDLRLGWEGERHGWAIDLQHHKLILENPPPEIQSFTLTHGFNLLTAQHVWLRSGWRFFVELGVVIAHPESTIRGLEKDESTGWQNSGYEVCGPVTGGGVGSSLRLFPFLELAFEARVTWSTVAVDVAEGRANLDNLALHLLLGPRIRIR